MGILTLGNILQLIKNDVQYMQCSSQNFTIAGSVASVSNCSTVNSCDNPAQFFYSSQCKAKLTNPCTKVGDFCPCTHNQP